MAILITMLLQRIFSLSALKCWVLNLIVAFSEKIKHYWYKVFLWLGVSSTPMMLFLCLGKLLHHQEKDHSNA